MKKRKVMKLVFKSYNMEQMRLPQRYEKIISEDHLVPVVNQTLKRIADRLMACAAKLDYFCLFAEVCTIS
jgi:hypothetical protein